VERAQGIPLYAIETVRALADRGALEQQQDGRLVATGELGELEVPASLTALLAARLDALDPDERTVAKAVSVFSGSFPREAAVALADLPEQQLDVALAGLLRRQVLVIRADPLSPERGQYAFTQSMLRSVAYETLARRERKQRHLAAAEYLQQVFANQGEEVAEVIATHLLDAYDAAADDPDAGGLQVRAVDALRRAGRRAATVGAPEVAQRAYLTASEHADPVDQRALLQAAGEMALQAGRSEEALGLLETAAASCTAAGRQRDAALIVYPVADALRRLGRAGEAVERVTAALDTLQALGASDVDVGRLNAILGRVLVFTGDYERGAVAVEAALTAAEAYELPDVLAEALVNKALLYLFTSRPQEAAGLFAMAVAIGERHGLGDPLVRATGNLGALGLVWDLPDAREHMQTAVAITRRRGDRYRETLDAGNQIELDLLAGRWDELQALAHELLDPDLDRPGAEYLHCHLMELHALRGDPPAAAAALERLAAWKDTDDTELRASYDGCLVIAGVAEGQTEQALAHGLPTLQSAVTRLGPATDAVRESWPHTLQAALNLARHDDAHQIIALLADRPPGHVPPYLRAHLARGRALLNIAEGRHDTVQPDLQTAIDAFAKLKYPYWHAVTQTDLAAWHTDQHQPDQAAPLLEQAIATLTPLRAAPALTRAQALTQTPTTAP
jgi:tetratricopeptide (TPR) repeat protein